MRLSQKFLIVFLAVALVPLLLAGIVILRDTQKSLRAAVLGAQHLSAQRTADAVRREMDNLHNALEVMAKNLDNPRKISHAVLEAALTHYPIILEIRVCDAAGREIDRLGRLQKGWDAPTPPWEAVKDGILKQGFYWGDVEWSSARLPTLLYALPMEQNSGNVSGFLVVRANLYVLTEALRRLNLDLEDLVYVMDSRGRVIAHSARDDAFPPPVLPWETLKGGWSEGEFAGPMGTKVLAVKAQVPDTGWTLIFQQPSVKALRIVAQLTDRLALSLGFAALLAVVLSFAMARFLVRPLNQFREAVTKMKNGQFDALITFRSRDEIGAVAQELREAQEALESKTRDAVLGKMARLLGHDLRQPLQAIGNSLEIIGRHVTGADQEAQKHFALSLESLNWAHEFIEEILTLGRSRPPLLRRFDLNKLGEDCLSRLKVPPGIEIVKSFSHENPSAILDEKEARKAVMNVLKNAVESIADSGRVEISTGCEDGFVFLNISDTGCGIPDQKKEKMFEEFTTKESGTGLGLAVVRKVMDQHRGHFRMESQLGNGTRVSLFFPKALNL